MWTHNKHSLEDKIIQKNKDLNIEITHILRYQGNVSQGKYVVCTVTADTKNSTNSESLWVKSMFTDNPKHGFRIYG